MIHRAIQILTGPEAKKYFLILPIIILFSLPTFSYVHTTFAQTNPSTSPLNTGIINIANVRELIARDVARLMLPTNHKPYYTSFIGKEMTGSSRVKYRAPTPESVDTYCNTLEKDLESKNFDPAGGADGGFVRSCNAWRDAVQQENDYISQLYAESSSADQAICSIWLVSTSCTSVADVDGRKVRTDQAKAAFLSADGALQDIATNVAAAKQAQYQSRCINSDGTEKTTPECTALKAEIAALEQTAAAAEESSTLSTECSATDATTWFTTCLYNGVKYIVSAVVIGIGGSIVYFAGLIFDYSLWFGIIRFGDVLNGTGVASGNGQSAVYSTWVLIRNLFNIIIVFQLLKIAITKIIGNLSFVNLGSSRPLKQMLTKIIIFTLFVNFSFFFTKAAIDLSNIATLQFYSGLGAGGVAEGVGTFNRGNIGIAIVEGLGIHSNVFFSDTPGELNQREVSGSTRAAGTDAGSTESFEDSIFGNILLFGLLLVAAFILLQGAFIFIGRAIFLILLVILSPLMFAGGIVGFVDKWSETWKKYLLEQLFVAPLYMAMLFIVLKLAGTRDKPGLLTIFNATGTGVSGYFGEMALMLVQAMIMAGLFVACVTIAKKFAGDSASQSMAFGNKVFGAGIGKAGRMTAGRLANRISNSQRLKGWSGKGGIRGAIADRSVMLADKGKNATFDYRNSKTIARAGSITGTNFNTGTGGTKGFTGERDAADKKKADNLAARESRLNIDTYGLEGDAKKKVEAENKKRQAEYKALTSINSDTTDAEMKKIVANTEGLEGDELAAAQKFNAELEKRRAEVKGQGLTRLISDISDLRSGTTGVRRTSTIARSQAQSARKSLNTEDVKKRDTKRRKEQYNDFINEYETAEDGSVVTEMVDGKEVKKVKRVREPEEAKEHWNAKKQELQQERNDTWKKIDRFRNPSQILNGNRILETENGRTAFMSETDFHNNAEKVKQLDKELAKLGDVGKNIDRGSKEFGIYADS